MYILFCDQIIGNDLEYARIYIRNVNLQGYAKGFEYHSNEPTQGHELNKNLFKSTVMSMFGIHWYLICLN